MSSRRLQPSARTNRRQRRQIQLSAQSDRALAQKLGIDVKTVSKWRRRQSVDDAPLGPKTPTPSNLAPDAEAFVVAVRQLTRASLEILLPRLQGVLPRLSRSTLYRVWRKWGVSRMPGNLPPSTFPFTHQSKLNIGVGEPFQLRAFRCPKERGVADEGASRGPVLRPVAQGLDTSGLKAHALDGRGRDKQNTNSSSLQASETQTPFHERSICVYALEPDLKFG